MSEIFLSHYQAEHWKKEEEEEKMMLVGILNLQIIY